MDNIPPRLFETLTLPNVAARCFVVRVADAQLTPDNLPTAGTLYRDWTLPSRLHVDTWGSYVYGWPLEAPAGYSAFAFVPALPTTPVVTPRLDPIWGAVLDHTYYCLRSATQLDVADTSTAIAVLGAAYTSRHVIEVRPPREMSGEVIEVTVTTAAAATVTQIDKPVDLTSGSLYTRTKTFTVADTTPTGAAPDSAGEYTTVTQQSHKLFVSVTDKASTLPNSRATAITWDSHDKMYWPAVLQSYEFRKVVATSQDRFTKLLSYNLRDPYSDDCKVTSRLWWQSTAYTVGEPDNLIASAINVRGNLESFSIPASLHEAFEYEEQNYTAPLSGAPSGVTSIMLQFQFGATPETDWPATIVRTRQRFVNGGYEVLEETFYRPTAYASSEANVIERPWVTADGAWYA